MKTEWDYTNLAEAYLKGRIIDTKIRIGERIRDLFWNVRKQELLEKIKMCPLIIELKKRNRYDIVTAVTGQHREMLEQVLDVFHVCPEYDLRIMKEGQSLIGILTAVMDGVSAILDCENPDLTLVHGDMVTAYAATVACYMKGFKTGHVEAGLRTYNITEPFPEEFNRRLIGMIAAYHFNPYGDGTSCIQIADIIEKILR